MTIDEIALKVARKHGTGGWQTLEDMVLYGKALLAELANQEAVAEVVSEGSFGMEVVSLVSPDDYSIKPGTKLYAAPIPKE